MRVSGRETALLACRRGVAVLRGDDGIRCREARISSLARSHPSDETVATRPWVAIWLRRHVRYVRAGGAATATAARLMAVLARMTHTGDDVSVTASRQLGLTGCTARPRCL